ncbi:MAG: hypothetical protein JWP31_388 [Aeromicrobium sp.]|nr:hypothetical protein [Aeromicrobium sp.]
MRCMIEVRPAGHEPVVITGHASTTDGALSGAVEKMSHSLAIMFGNLDDRRRGALCARVSPIRHPGRLAHRLAPFGGVSTQPAARRWRLNLGDDGVLR